MPRSKPSAKTENKMKTHVKITLLMACGTLGLAAGCGKNDDASSPSSTSTNTRTLAPRTNPPSPNAAEVQGKADAEKAAQVARAAEAQKQAAATAAAEAAKLEASRQQAAADKLAADKAAADLRAQTAAAAAQEQARIQGLIHTVTNLTGQSQYTDALKVLAELATLKLSPEQQTLVEGLKKTVQQQATQAATDKAAAGASQAIGDALGGKK